MPWQMYCKDTFFQLSQLKNYVVCTCTLAVFSHTGSFQICIANGGSNWNSDSTPHSRHSINKFIIITYCIGCKMCLLCDYRYMC